MASTPEHYPAAYESDAVLSDGGTVHVRPIRPDDSDALESLHARLSAETVYLRFFSPLPRLTPQLLERFTHVDYDDRLAFVAELGDDIVAVARYDRLPGTTDAEVAFVVDDNHQGRGLGSLLLEHLAVAARDRGITRFVADTLPGNGRMLGVFEDAGFVEERHFDGSVIRVSFPIAATATSLAAVQERERRASARSIQRLLAPRSIAVVGASRRPGTIGHEVLVNLLGGDFQGPVYPVHPTARQVASVRAYPTVLDVPDDVDLAVIVVPAGEVAEVVEQCGRKKVGGLVIISAGFADAGPQGAAAERAMIERARRLGMRVIGPNCMGVVNTAAEVGMNATFAPLRPVAGRVGFSSQSGALGVAILDELNRIGLGVSTFVSLGNKADVSSNDLLHYWQGDDATDVVLLYLETFGNPRTFARVARRLSRTKPIVAVKSARDHDADSTVDALFRQSGIIRVDTLEQLFDVAQLLVHQPLPEGHRVAIVGNADGPGVLTADACEGRGLTVAQVVDLGSRATADDYEQAIGKLLGDGGVDAVIVIFFPPLVVREEEVEAAIGRAAAAHAKPVLANFLARRGVSGDRTVPSYRYPEAAAIALAHVADYAAWRRRPEGSVPTLDGVDREAALAVVAAALATTPEGVDLDRTQTDALLAAYSIAPTGAVSVVSDPLFGPVLQVGPRSAVLPLTDRDAADLASDPAVQDTLLRVAALAEDRPEVTRLTLDGPLVHVAPWRPRPELAMRRLR